MRFALVNGDRQEAQPDLVGACPACDRPMVARCGETRAWHWAHKGTLMCDRWWENETDWHRSWKNEFPSDWQEVVHTAADGERHIADLKTPNGWVIEFQRSHLDPDERRSREAFYEKLAWVLDGTRRKRDATQLIRTFNDALPIRGRNDPVRQAFTADCRLFGEWAGSRSPVFVDLGEPERLWCMFPQSFDSSTYIAMCRRAQFIDFHRSADAEKGRQFEAFVYQVPNLIAARELGRRNQAVAQQSVRPRTYRRGFRF
jgi:hypothetical protein